MMTSVEGEVAPGKKKGVDDASWVDVNLTGQKNERKHIRSSFVHLIM
jgi:hypothetical protein